MVRAANRIALLLVTSLAMAAPAVASQAFLDGDYGNTDGCAYSKTGESTGSDNFFLLTNEGITTAASYCSFKEPVTKNGTSFAATVSCSAEGESGEADDSVDILRTGNDYTIAFNDGTRWGPLKRCK
ncbi:hypothetical protein [Pararhizobium sp. PWRC1-1]|uniref:hypothetical protein n=1 Tax=Pararhizobium sp. PWRC1-1 TaxID=2804566 RepID=UPI003CED858B